MSQTSAGYETTPAYMHVPMIWRGSWELSPDLPPHPSHIYPDRNMEPGQAQETADLAANEAVLLYWGSSDKLNQDAGKMPNG